MPFEMSSGNSQDRNFVSVLSHLCACVNLVTWNSFCVLRQNYILLELDFDFSELKLIVC